MQLAMLSFLLLMLVDSLLRMLQDEYMLISISLMLQLIYPMLVQK